jgi:hypothetical protein
MLDALSENNVTIDFDTLGAITIDQNSKIV